MEFTKMRRFKQELSAEETRNLLKKGSYGILAVKTEEGLPYGVPVNYVYDKGFLYFHCAVEGRKLTALKANPEVCFTVTLENRVVPEKYTTYFRSVICFGKAEIVQDERGKEAAFLSLCHRFIPMETDAEHQEKIAKGGPHAVIVRITIEHMTGKEAIELTKARNQA